MAYIRGYEYKPSAQLLTNLFEDLVARRKSSEEALRAVWKEQQGRSFGFGISEDWEIEQEQQKLRAKEDALRAERDLVEALLRPFDAEASRFKEEQDKKACDAIMAL